MGESWNDHGDLPPDPRGRSLAYLAAVCLVVILAVAAAWLVGWLR